MNEGSTGLGSSLPNNMQIRETSGPWRVVVADDHPIARRGLAALLSAIPELEICGEAANAREVIRVVKRTKPQLAVIGVNLNAVDDIEAIRTIRTMMPETEVVALTLVPSVEVAQVALRVGARAVVAKTEPPELVIEAVQRVQKREVFVSGQLSEQLAEELAEFLHRDGRPDLKVRYEEIVSPLMKAESQVFEDFQKIVAASLQKARRTTG
jgi:DNA-binding NarL/FixJ family response regulator